MFSQNVWRVIRTLLLTYLISAVLLAALSFALFRFRLPEAQVNTGVRIVYILSCLAGGILAGRTDNENNISLIDIYIDPL